MKRHSEEPPEPLQSDDTVAMEARTVADVGTSVGPAVQASRIDRYVLVRELGEGGMGTVWLAEQQEPVRREVALKVIKLGMDTREVIRRFEAERQALAMMNHEGIARVLDAGTTEQGSPYFVMEYVRGESITAYCDRRHLTVRDRLQLFARVCEAVQHAHQKGIIHRDLKPSNVLVADQDGRPAPKVIDFGLAKAMEQRLDDATQHTQLGAILGTPAYMSPEQVDPLSLDIDTRADIYSLGVVLYELLVGAAPFSTERLRAAGMTGIPELIRFEEPPGLTRRLSGLGESAAEAAASRHAGVAELFTQLRGDLEWVVARAMDKDRERRYPSASELAEDIERHLNDEPVQARPSSAMYRLGKLVRRRRGAVLATAAVLVALVGGLAATTVMYVRAENARIAAEYDNQLTSSLNDFFNFDILIAGARMGADVTMREVVDIAAAKIPGRFPDNPVTEARFRGSMGLMYESFGDPAAAEPHYRAGLALTGDPADPADWASWGREALAWVLAAQGDLAEARDLQEQALADYRDQLGLRDGRTLGAMLGLSVTSTLEGDHEAATALQEQLIALWRAQPPTLNNRGWLEALLARMAETAEGMRRRGELAQAQLVLPQVLQILEVMKRPSHVATVTAVSSIAQMLGQLEDPAASDALVDRLCWLVNEDESALDAAQSDVRAEIVSRCLAR